MMPPTLKACTPPPYPMAPSMTPVTRFIRESAEVFTFDLAPERATPFTPGQFNMLYAFGVGEIPISISGAADAPDRLTHTIRAVGPVSAALGRLKAGDQVGLRGPFGVGWPVEEAKGFDVLLIGGGIGLAPLRPAIYWLLRHRAAYGRVGVLYGARTPDDLIFVSELEEWRKTPDFQLRVAVERAGPEWTGDVGYVTPLLSKLRYDPADAIAMICGPEVMIRATALALEDAGIADSRIFVSMERNMKCAIGHCGHCQFGPLFICKDGPVHRYDRVRDLLAYREL
ncbi:FAD/NAD(P)-binding protein [Methylocystis sp. H62]|jgi:NAD(P)H-flavin reductase|uniref:FAD/NAD(P)-binding protein n=1 Tax=Methylocystis sp. H62 TaxID=2785789 RepID=UPI0018C292ED|nr:FAD/NAD(P)-binding protein [Methylocystis sp. H62]MBG0792258.1 FAD/NAD(P)-binding protein [Methylocystis sp. H62]